MNTRTLRTVAPSAGLLLAAAIAYAQTGQPATQATAPATPQAAAQEHAEAIKKSLATSATLLKPYEWIETTTVSLKGEVKSTTQDRCYHGDDGTLQKVPVESTPEESKRGLRGKIVEDKKAEMTDYMTQVTALVKSYVPPAPALLKACVDGGRASVDVLEPGKKVRVNFKDYKQKGDVLGIELNTVTNQLLGASVSTYLTDASDAVGLVVTFATLPNGATYASETVLTAQAKGITVDVKNTGYRVATAQ